MTRLDFKTGYVYVALLLMASTMLTSVAGINLAVLLLLLSVPWFFQEWKNDVQNQQLIRQFFGLIVAICVWDVITNLMAGATVKSALWAMQHDLRTFAFVALLWPVFAVERIARFALWSLVAGFVVVGGVNWIATAMGKIFPGQYLWATMHHLHGQMSVGCVFLLAQVVLSGQTRHKWLAVLGMAVLLGSMFMANERRAGYFLLVAGVPVWIILNRDRFTMERFRWWLVIVGLGLLIIAANSSIVQYRVMLVWQEINHYLTRSPLDRANDFSSVGLRLQFYVSIWEIIKNHWLMGVGSLQFAAIFQEVNLAMGTTEPQRFTNPHNEYLFMLATKGVIGLFLYLAIFAQACRIAIQKTSDVQRVGLLMFVCLFMVSIFMNSMMIDMEEGHFTMLVLLIFLAPKNLDRFKYLNDVVRT